MNKFIALVLWMVLVGLVSCTKDDPAPDIEETTTYSFQRDGHSTISFSGQTTRIKMASALIGEMKNTSATTGKLLEMYRNAKPGGEEADPFSDPELNQSAKSIKEKVAASADYFSANTARSSEIKAQFEQWITAQVEEVFVNANTAAIPGTAGQVADGSSVRYVNAHGLEYNQLVNKGLIGALMTDQMLNNYLSENVLDETRVQNTAATTEEGKSYTTMEHKWDEAYGYLYGTSPDPANPNQTIGEDDKFLNEYVGKVDADPDFSGIAEAIYNAFKRGRAAIVAADYQERDKQADIIREKVSTVIAVRAVYYLQKGKVALSASPVKFGTAFHDLSESYGFIYSLAFTRKPGTGQPFISDSEISGYLSRLTGDGENGLWDVELSTIDVLSQQIAQAFDFSVEEAVGEE